MNIHVALSIADSKQATGSGQAKVINHHLMKSLKTTLARSQAHKKEIELIRTEDTFIIKRYLGYPELSTK